MSVKLVSSLQTPLDRVLLRQKQLQLSNQQLAARLGISAASWGMWKGRRGVIPPSHYTRVAERLGLQLKWLITGEGESDLPPVPAPMPLDVQILKEVIQCVEQYLKVERIVGVTAEKKAEFLAIFYDQAVKQNGVDKENIVKLLHLAIVK